MGVLTILYTIFIRPLELLFEIIYVVADRIIQNPGLSIIVLSLAVSFLVLPLYRRADRMQQEERDIEAKLDRGVRHIKETFSGDERFLMLSTYYRQNGYKPYYVLKSSVSLLLQIPFFIAAYRFLSGLSLLKGASFGPIADLGSPDGMLKIGALTLNLLPILMTLVNVISGMIYTKGMNLKNKLQLYGMAAVFLVLLYRSPAGLVFYWTLNNLFSLVKNLFYKLKDPGKVLKILSAVAGVLLAGVFLLNRDFSRRSRVVFIFCGIMLMLPLLLSFLPARERKTEIQSKEQKTVFVLSALFSALLIGLLIPSALAADSPAEFVSVLDPRNPSLYVLRSFLTAAGFFCVWAVIFYGLAEERFKKYFTILMWVAAICFVTDYMFFGKNLGNLSAALKFDAQPHYSMKEYAVNALVLIAVALAGLFLLRKKERIAGTVAIAGSLAVCVMGILNLSGITRAYRTIEKSIDSEGGVPHITLSRTGKNVVVIMMDRMIGSFLPYMMYEKPELYDSLDGFTYYPNVISFGTSTNTGAPGLFGGYEYVPQEMNRRTDKTIPEKHEEALKLMPYLFDDAGYEVTVFDPPYAGYQWIPDLSVFDERPQLNVYNTIGRIHSDSLVSGDLSGIWERNFFLYGLMKACPCVLQPVVYNQGSYLSFTTAQEDRITEEQWIDGIQQSTGYATEFIKSYNVLTSLPGMTDFTDDGSNVFFEMTNKATHEACILKEPEYEPREHVDNREFDAVHHIRYDAEGNSIDLNPGDAYYTDDGFKKTTHYQVNMASLLKLADWFDLLKEEGVYDNTRIILVSDHGFDLLLDPAFAVKSELKKGRTYDLMKFHCLMMVKDFDATGFTTDDTFMTNADVPTIAFEGTVPDPVNPFTGKKIDNAWKYENEYQMNYTNVSEIERNEGVTFVKEEWYSVHDDIFDRKNWSILGAY